MGAFLGNIIGRVISRVLMMAIIVGGGQYYLSQNGGLSGVMGGAGSSAAMAQPISVGLGGLNGIAASLGIGDKGAPAEYEAQGRISSIREECRLVRKVEGKVQRTEPLPCDRARTALTYPQFDTYTLNEALIATYIYYDMDGVNILRGRTDAQPGQKVGDVIRLSISRMDPHKATPI